MSKLLDISLVILIIGTLMEILSLFLFSLISPVVFTYTLISGLVLIFISIILGFITRNEYHTIKLKSGFPLKLDHLIIFICALVFLFSFTVFADILHVRYSGTSPYYTLSWVIIMICGTIVVYYLRKRQKFSDSSE
ncbi:MAG: hypothetical protein R6W84_17900 [Promethearchaeia archaeon]